MMQPSDRCAICDRDNNVMTLCSLHHWQAVMRRLVDNGLISDWEPLPTGKHTTPVKHRDMLLMPCAPPLYWQASIVALCSSLDVWWDDGTVGNESIGDGIAIHCGRVADWVIQRWVELLRGKGRQAA